MKTKRIKAAFFLALACMPILAPVSAGELVAGKAVVVTSPRLPAALDGQMALRVASRAETPFEADILLLESTGEGGEKEQLVWITCDLVTIPDELQGKVREKVAKQVPGIDPRKIIFNATHTHTGPVVRDGWYAIPDSVLQVSAYHQEVSEALVAGIRKAQATKQRARISYGMGYAKTAYNRRAVYRDGTARMYGPTAGDDFRGIEGFEDQELNTLYIFGNKDALLALCINVSSPAQVVESRSVANADYIHPLRTGLRRKFNNPDLAVLTLIGAAGNVVPRPMYSKTAEKRMLELRRVSQEQEIARRITKEVLDIYDVVKAEKHEAPLFRHVVKTLNLPMRMVTEDEMKEAVSARDKDKQENPVLMRRRMMWNQEVVERYEQQQKKGRLYYPAEVHVIRLGDVGFCTNPFELFTEFGIQIKGRSKAVQTMVVQLTGAGTYVPTAAAVKGGHYSAVVQSNRVGPEGGQQLVDETVALLDELWEDKGKPGAGGR